MGRRAYTATIVAVYSEGQVVVPAQNEANSLHQDGYGSFHGETHLLTLSPWEVMYLVERSKLAVVDEKSRQKLVFKELLEEFSSDDPLLLTRFIVYRDLRGRGFVVRNGPNLGVDFLIYQRGSYGKIPPRYLVYTIWEGVPASIKELYDVLEATERSGKILRLAAVDRRGEVVYYTLSEEFPEFHTNENLQ